MKKLLLGALALALVAGIAHAAFNIRQNSDGTADWVDGLNNREFAIGEQKITLYLEDISTQSTTYAPVPFNATIRRIWAVAHGALTSDDATLRVYFQTAASAAATNNAFTQITPNAVLTFNASDAAGQITNVSPGDTSANTVDVIEVSVGDVIAVNTNGNSVTDVDATIVIELEPR